MTARSLKANVVARVLCRFPAIRGTRWRRQGYEVQTRRAVVVVFRSSATTKQLLKHCSRDCITIKMMFARKKKRTGWRAGGRGGRRKRVYIYVRLNKELGRINLEFT